MCFICTLGGSCATLTARPNAPGKLLLSRTTNEPGAESFSWAIAVTQSSSSAQCRTTKTVHFNQFFIVQYEYLANISSHLKRTLKPIICSGVLVLRKPLVNVCCTIATTTTTSCIADWLNKRVHIRGFGFGNRLDRKETLAKPLEVFNKDLYI